jgi:tetratricopeptide (TPR) repeat protein
MVELQVALKARYGRARLKEVLLLLEKQYDEIEVVGEDYPANVLRVVEAANREGWLMRLLVQTRDDPAIHAIYEAETEERASEDLRLDARTDHIVVAFSCTPTGQEMVDEIKRHLLRTRAPVQTWHGTGQKLRGSDVLLFIATPDAVEPDSPCRAEVAEALAKGLDVIAVGFDATGNRPEWMERLDFADGADGWIEMDRRLRLAGSPRRRLRALLARRDVVDRNLDRAVGAQRDRINAELAEIEELITDLMLREEPGGPPRAAEPEPVTGEASAEAEPICVVGKPPVVPDGEFQDRVPYIEEIVLQLRRPGVRMIALLGRAGIGKTGLIAKLLAGFRSPEAAWRPAAFIYLPVLGFRPVNAATLVLALLRTIQAGAAATRLEAARKRAVPWRDLLDQILDELADTPVVLVIDNADELLDGDGNFADDELRELVDRMVVREDHAVRLLLVSQTGAVPAGSIPVPLEEGLEQDFARGFLLALDADGLLDLKHVPKHDLNYLCTLVEGSPRALELAFALLSGGSDRSVAELIGLLHRNTGRDMAEFALTETFDRLDREDKRILQILAIYGRPVPPAAVDELLRHYVNGAESARRLIRLQRLRLVRRDLDGGYYVPPRQDRQILLKTIATGGPKDLAASPKPLTVVMMSHLAADYFGRRPTTPEDITRIDHLADHLAEVELRIQAGELDRALDVIDDVNEQYLMRWSYSSVAVRTLNRLEGQLTGFAELRRRCALAWAYGKQRNPDRMQQEVTAVLALRPMRRTRARLMITLGNAYFEQGRLDRAAEQYHQALSIVPVWLVRHGAPIRATAHLELGSVAARAGDFEGALARYDRVSRFLTGRPDIEDGERTTMSVAVAASRGRVHTHLGDDEAARRYLDEAMERAERAVLNFELGECYIYEAQRLILRKNWAGAVKAAGQAARTAAETGDAVLRRNAQEVLALAGIGRRELKEAADAIRIAVRRDPTATGLTLQGMIAHRSGDDAAASAMFERALMLLPSGRAEDRQCDFHLLDERGLVLTGLGRYDEAAAAYRAAREMTSADGVTLRAGLWFDLLDLASAEAAGVRRIATAAVNESQAR